MIAAEPPPVEIVVMSRRDSSEVVVAQDLPLVLVKGARREEALVRRAVFVTSSLSVVRPAADVAGDRYRWSYRSFLQRQVCFTSMTGLFSCTEPQVQALPDVAEGEAPAEPDPARQPLAEAARTTLVASLKARSTAILAADRRAVVDPALKAGGVTIQAAAPSRP